MSFTQRIKDWLVELDAEAAKPDSGDGWKLTEQGKIDRETSRQRAEDLRTLIDAKTL